MSFPRKRVSIACNFCRHRKRKCDGQKPSCGLCSEAGAECEYQEATPDRCESDKTQEALLRRISELEDLLKKQNDLLSQSQCVDEIPPHRHPPARFPLHSPISTAEHAPTAQSRSRSTTAAGPTLHLPPGSPAAPGHTPGSAFSESDPPLIAGGTIADNDHDTPLTIPLGHQTATASLFALPKIQTLIGEYPPDFFYQIESQRSLDMFTVQPLPDFLATLDVSRSTADLLIAGFFSRIYPSLPVVTREFLYSTYDEVMSTNPCPDASTALILVVLALGSLVVTSDGMSSTSLAYFSAAYEILTAQWPKSFEPDLALPSALVYGSVYLSYMVMPLQSWRLVHMASTNLQLQNMQMQGKSTSQDEDDCLSRLTWACFLLECDSLAEFHLPRSGIEVLIDGMPFPHFSEQDERDSLAFLAVCSMRRLLNRIHSTVYANPTGRRSTDPAPSPMSPAGLGVNVMEKVCAELAHQLDTWYNSLPDAIRPDLQTHIPRDILDGWLRLRYWSARHIIFRPCVVHVTMLSENEEVAPLSILEDCQVCLESCQNFLATAGFLLKERTQFTWMIIQSSLACALVLTNASASPRLRHLVSNITEVLGSLIDSMERWATPDSSADAAVCILQTMRQKQRLKRLYR